MADTPASKLGEFETEALPHLKDLFRTAVRVMGDSSRAEDVVQEVYLQAWKAFARFESGTNCRAWLFKILFNTIHHHRRKWFGLRVVPDSEELMESTAAAPMPFPETVTDGEVLSALDSIPRDYRSVVLLADVEEFAYKEIAEILAVPIGTVMSRLSRGRRLLREQLAGVAKSYGIGERKHGGQSA